MTASADRPTVGHADPIDVTCSTCGSPPGHPCTVPTDTSRSKVSWYHFNREHSADLMNGMS